MTDFVTKDGQVVSTLQEMSAALSNMSEEDFSHHVNQENNDVANWIRDIHHNEELASAIRNTTNKATIIKLLDELTEASNETVNKPLDSEAPLIQESSEVDEPAKFPQEEYHQTTAIGKEDMQMHDSYNDSEEWDAAKEAAHPNEDIANPVKQEATVIDKMPDADPQLGVVEHPLATEQKPVLEMPQTVPKDLRPPIPGATLKDRLIPGIVGLILGLIAGYFLGGFF